MYLFDLQLCSLEADNETEPRPELSDTPPAVPQRYRAVEAVRCCSSGPGVQAAFMYAEHPLSRWVCWKAVGEVGKGQMEHRGKFTSDT